MAEDSVKRKLRSILCADIKGYSRIMGEDEVGNLSHTFVLPGNNIEHKARNGG